MEHLNIPSDFVRRLMNDCPVTTSRKKKVSQEEKADELMGTGEFVKKVYDDYGMNGRRYKQIKLYRADGSYIVINHQGGLGGMLGGRK